MCGTGNDLGGIVTRPNNLADILNFSDRLHFTIYRQRQGNMKTQIQRLGDNDDTHLTAI